MRQRLEANRINAKLSKGPTTELGKSRSKLNALKHGLSGKKIVIGDEDPMEFEALSEALEHDFQPETALESELVKQLAGSLWRLRRVPAIEAEIVKKREERAYSRLLSKLKDDTMSRIQSEARARYGEKFGNGSLAVQEAIINGTYDERLAELRSEVLAEKEKEGDLDSLILEQANEQYQESRESELLLLIQDEDGMIEKLSRYQASLMNAVNRMVQQLRLLRIMRSPSKVIAFE